MHAFHAWLQRDPSRLLAVALIALAGLCGLAFFNGIGDLGLIDKTEGLFAEVPRQMLASGDWVTPRWNGEAFFDYPVWGYWMVAISYKLFGLTAWAARLPAALAATATVFALFAVVFRLAPSEEGQRARVGRALLCATVLTLSPGWVGWGRSSVTDMFLASAITLALLGFVLAWAAGDGTPQRRLGHVGLALFCGIAVLAKGPIGLLLPGLVIIGFLLLKGRFWAEVRRTPWPPILALFLAVTAPWYALATAANGSTFLYRFLGFSNVERFTSVLYSHPGPPWYYLPWVLLLLLPWSLFLPVAMMRLQFWRLRVWRQQQAAAADLPLLSLLWLVLMLAFFSSAATKLPGYILPAMPAGALLVGLLFRPFPSTEARPLGAGLRWSGWINALLLALISIAAVLAPRWIGGDPSFPGFAQAVAASSLPLLLALPAAGGAIGLAALLLAASRNADWLPRLWIADAAAFAAVVALLLPSLTPLLDRERLLPVRELAIQAGRQAGRNEPLLVVGYRRYSVVFYSGRAVNFVSSAHEARELLRATPAGDADGTVLLLGSDPELLEFGIGPGDAALLARRDSHRLVRLPVITLNRLAQR